jgi:flagellar biosynthesis protein FlhG
MLTIAITSGKGGVGKTAFSANLAAALAETGARTTVFDADLQLANLDITLGIAPEFNLQHVVSEQKTLAEIMTDAPGGIRAITGASAVPSLMRAGPKKLNLFFSQFNDLAKSTDVLIFDCAAGLENRVLSFLKMSDEVILVISPDPTSVTDAYATAKTIFRRRPEARIHVVFNMCSPNEGHKLFTMFEKVIWSYLKKKVSYLGSVRFDQMAALATRKRELFVVSNPDCKAAQDVRSLAQTVQQWRYDGIRQAG